MEAREAAALELLIDRDPSWIITDDVASHDPDLFPSRDAARQALEELEDRGLAENVGGPSWRATTWATSPGELRKSV